MAISWIAYEFHSQMRPWSMECWIVEPIFRQSLCSLCTQLLLHWTSPQQSATNTCTVSYYQPEHTFYMSNVRTDRKFGQITSLAMLAPMRTQQLTPSCSEMRVEIMHGPSFLTSIPLIKEIAWASALILPIILLHIPSMNWCGVTNTNMFASLTASIPPLQLIINPRHLMLVEIVKQKINLSIN